MAKVTTITVGDAVGGDGDSGMGGHGCTDSMGDHGCTVIKEGALDFEIHDMTTGVDVHMSKVATFHMTMLVVSVGIIRTIIIKMIRGSHFQENSLVWDRGRWSHSKKLIHMEGLQHSKKIPFIIQDAFLFHLARFILAQENFGTRDMDARFSADRQYMPQFVLEWIDYLPQFQYIFQLKL